MNCQLPLSVVEFLRVAKAGLFWFSLSLRVASEQFEASNSPNVPAIEQDVPVLDARERMANFFIERWAKSSMENCINDRQDELGWLGSASVKVALDEIVASFGVGVEDGVGPACIVDEMAYVSDGRLCRSHARRRGALLCRASNFAFGRRERGLVFGVELGRFARGKVNVQTDAE